MIVKLLYLHGLYSKPGGTKPTFLSRHGYEVVNPSLPDDDFAMSVQNAQAAYEECRPDLIVGSSRGGAVAINIETASTPLVLIAPAWRRWGTVTTVKALAIILHSCNDAVIPIADSEALVHVSGLPASALVVVGHDHNMIDGHAFRALLAAVESFRRPSPRTH